MTGVTAGEVRKHLFPWPPTFVSALPGASGVVSIAFSFSLLHTVQGSVQNADPTIDFLFPYHLHLFSFSIRQNPNDFNSLSPPLPSCSVSTSPFILPTLIPFFSVAFPSLSFAPSFPLNGNSSLWNGKVIYFDSLGIWPAVLSGATRNVTGNMATVNILPPAMKSNQ